MEGTVKWFNATKGYGFITGEDGTDYIRLTIVAEDGTTTEIEIPVGTGYFGGDVDDGGSDNGGGGSDGGS